MSLAAWRSSQRIRLKSRFESRQGMGTGCRAHELCQKKTNFFGPKMELHEIGVPPFVDDLTSGDRHFVFVAAFRRRVRAFTPDGAQSQQIPVECGTDDFDAKFKVYLRNPTD
jgi:hypothetical protein